MKKALDWLWKTGIVSTFLAGLFVVLPIAITVGLISWLGSTLAGWFGPRSVIGRIVGLQSQTTDEPDSIAWMIGCVIVLAAIWGLGVLAKSIGKNTVAKTFDAVLERIPIINILYKPVAQVVGMLKQDGQEEMKGMSVVYCAFGGEGGAGFLGLLVSEHVYHFGDQDYQIVYIPTSPVPMSGGILFAPAKTVHRVEMSVDDLMQIYFSIGVMSSKIIPEKYVTS